MRPLTVIRCPSQASFATVRRLMRRETFRYLSRRIILTQPPSRQIFVLQCTIGYLPPSKREPIHTYKIPAFCFSLRQIVHIQCLPFQVSSDSFIFTREINDLCIFVFLQTHSKCLAWFKTVLLQFSKQQSGS